ncbi:unnamed protein product [Adineta steineri]|uniref:Uncharacterized protein n=2 Tax=Adineta steineri TaxID=433720 RepID=A0A819JC38_9BILA|nr:unnamed protein product [Adineta steineri]
MPIRTYLINQLINSICRLNVIEPSHYVQTTTEEPLRIFNASEQVRIANGIKELKPDNSLTNFSKISDMIKKATGMLPVDLIPILQKLSDSYSNTTMLLKANFAHAAAISSKFVVKGYRVIQRGMNNDDEKVLKKFEQQLNTDIINKLDALVESSRSELLEIYKQALQNARSKKVTTLLTEKDELETNLTRISEELTKKSSECGANQEKIEALSYEKQLFEKALQDPTGAKKEATKKIKILRLQIPAYENKVQQHLDTPSEERGSFWIFSWKVRGIHIDNGIKITREKLNRLIQRINTLEAIVANWSNIDFVNRVSKLNGELRTYKGKQSPLEHEYKQLKKSYDLIGKNFETVIQEIDEVYKSTGTDDINSFKMVNELVDAGYYGVQSIAEAYEPKFNKWKQNAITVAGGNGEGQQLNQLCYPEGIFIDDKKNIFIADFYNHRIVEWKYNATEGQIIASENGQVGEINQLNHPTDVIVDQQNHLIIIADYDNKQVIQWLNHDQQILIHNINCYGLAMDKNRFLYVSNWEKNEVRRWKMGEYDNKGIVVAGGNGQGDQVNQLNFPSFIFVDKDQSVYVSDTYNHRVMKWRKDAEEGTIVAGGNGDGKNLNQLSSPAGIFVDDLGQIYVADQGNHRVMRWREKKEEGEIVVGGNGQGYQPNQLNSPNGLSFDDEGNLYVADDANNRIQKFETIL